MYLIKPILFSFFCTTAFAGLGDVLLTKKEYNIAAPRTRYHYQDKSLDNPENQVKDSKVYGLGIPNITTFHTYNQLGFGYSFPFTAALSSDSVRHLLPKELLPILDSLNAPEFYISLQSMNEYNSGLSPEDRGKLLLRPHYVLDPEAEPGGKDTPYNKSMNTTWHILGPHPTKSLKSGTTQFTLHPQANDIEPTYLAGTTIASPANVAQLDIDTDERKTGVMNRIHQFYSIVKDNGTGKAAITFHWLMSHRAIDHLRTALGEADALALQEPTMGHVFDVLEGNTGEPIYKKFFGSDRIAQLKSFFTGEDVPTKRTLSSFVKQASTRQETDALLFAALNPHVRGAIDAMGIKDIDIARQFAALYKRLVATPEELSRFLDPAEYLKQSEEAREYAIQKATDQSDQEELNKYATIFFRYRDKGQSLLPKK